MYRFLSEEWIKAYKEEWNKNENLKSGLKNFTASIKYYIENNDQVPVELIVGNGIAESAGFPNRIDYDFEMWASIENWKKLASGNLGPRAAMLTKKLKFKGSMVTAMKYMGPFEESLRMFGKIPTQW